MISGRAPCVRLVDELHVKLCSYRHWLGVNNSQLVTMNEPTIPIPFRDALEGVFLGMPEAEYHAAPGISHSILKHMQPTLAHGKAFLDSLETAEEDDNINLIIGSLVHHAILTPEVPFPKIVMEPETYPVKTGLKLDSGVDLVESKPWHNGANHCKDWHKTQKAEGLLVLKKPEWETVAGCVKSLARHPLVQKVMKGGQSEVSVFRRSPAGPLTKFRLDHIPGGQCLVDFKTVAGNGDASPRRFAKIILDRGYDTQAAWYFDGWNDLEFSEIRPDFWELKAEFLFIVVEKEPPYAVATYLVDKADMQRGREKNWARLSGMVQAQVSGVWPGYAEEPVVIKLPNWA